MITLTHILLTQNLQGYWHWLQLSPIANRICSHKGLNNCHVLCMIVADTKSCRDASSLLKTHLLIFPSPPSSPTLPSPPPLSPSSPLPPLPPPPPPLLSSPPPPSPPLSPSSTLLKPRSISEVATWVQVCQVCYKLDINATLYCSTITDSTFAETTLGPMKLLQQLPVSGLHWSLRKTAELSS